MNTEKYEKIRDLLTKALADLLETGGDNDVAHDEELINDAVYYLREALKEIG